MDRVSESGRASGAHRAPVSPAGLRPPLFIRGKCLSGHKSFSSELRLAPMLPDVLTEHTGARRMNLQTPHHPLEAQPQSTRAHGRSPPLRPPKAPATSAPSWGMFGAVPAGGDSISIQRQRDSRTPPRSKQAAGSVTVRSIAARLGWPSLWPQPCSLANTQNRYEASDDSTWPVFGL